jgi:tRNA(His) 5'-end guanylyltransferase
VIERIRQYIWKRRRARALRNIREAFAYWGLIVDLTDEQLEQRIYDTAHLFRSVGFTVKEAAEALRIRE